MKQKQLSKYAKQQLAIWGIHICPRPDIFDNRNREITVVIDESCGDTVIFEDALTIPAKARKRGLAVQLSIAQGLLAAQHEMGWRPWPQMFFNLRHHGKNDADQDFWNQIQAIIDSRIN